jgi:hypothetical protein
MYGVYLTMLMLFNFHDVFVVIALSCSSIILLKVSYPRAVHILRLLKNNNDDDDNNNVYSHTIGRQRITYEWITDAIKIT